MATVTLTIPDEHVDRVIHALCASADLEETASNAKRAVIEYVKSTVFRIELQEAEEAALALVLTKEEALASVDDPDVAEVVS